MTWLPGWAFRKRIIIPNVHVDSNLIDFPFYVKIDDADFHEARTDGHDIRFTLSDGTTLLEYEREHWAGGNGSPGIAHLWVKVPSILASGGAVIYIYYGKRDAPDGEDAPNVWDANFKGVWHLKDITPSTVADSTGVNDGTKLAANEPIEADGKIYKGQDFDGEDDKVNCGQDASLDITSKISISAWYYLPEAIPPATYPGLVGKGHNYGWDLYFYPNYALFIVNVDGVRQDFRFTSASMKVGEWVHLAVTYDGITGIGNMYVNGELDDTETEAAGTIGIRAVDLEIGVEGSYYFKGFIDEVRISNIARATAWYKFEHYNINEADNEITWGIEEAVARGVQASREEPELLLTGIPKDITFIGKEKPVFISKK